MSWMVLDARITFFTPARSRNVSARDSTEAASLFTGSMRYDGGRSSAVTLSTISGESANSRLNSW